MIQFDKVDKFISSDSAFLWSSGRLDIIIVRISACNISVIFEKKNKQLFKTWISGISAYAGCNWVQRETRKKNGANLMSNSRENAFQMLWYFFLKNGVENALDQFLPVKKIFDI